MSEKQAAPAKAPEARRFYAQALSETERLELPEALAVDGVDEEIAVLRLRLRTLLDEGPAQLELFYKGIDLLTKVVARRYKLPRTDVAALGEEMERLRQEVQRLLKVEGDG